jgi:LPXTG-site transpeptidase (sortase) family protein
MRRAGFSRSVRPLWIAVPMLSVSLLVGGCGPGTSQSSTPPPAGPTVSGSVLAGGSTQAGTVGMSRSVPVSLKIPAIDAQSSLVALGLNADQTVQLPPVSTPMQAAWFDGSPTPGQVGPAVILGHVDGDKQEGIFFRLHELKVGDQVLVTRQDGSTATFTVTGKQEIAKDQFPSDEVYGDTPDPELRLITCGGSFDSAAHSYVDNVIIFAKLS